MIACRVLPHSHADGPAHMATDEALLDAVAADPTAAIVRTYSWSVPTLSLGYFQAYRRVEADARWDGRAVVRRATGGGALWHDREVTYAVVIPGSHPLARPSATLYRAVHAAIGGYLRDLGIAARRRGEDDPPAAGVPDRPFLCFADRDADDVVVDRVKLVGSAQRRRAGAVLQHGSVLLARSAVTPELPGLEELAEEVGREPGGPAAPAEPLRWAAVLGRLLPEVLGGDPRPGNLTSWERDRADTLRRDVYGNPAWTRRR